MSLELSMSQQISIKGKQVIVPATRLDEVVIIVQGKFLKIAEIFDEYWLEADKLPDPDRVLPLLSAMDDKPDVFTFAQRVPHTEPRFDYQLEWDNVAVIPVSSHAVWSREQISPATRRNIRASEKKGVVVKEDCFNETYVRGIMSIFNESPVRHGRKYWHYGKEFSDVEAENGTYRDRSSFLGAYYNGEMIGYMKIVWDTHSAAIMQILSKMQFLDKRPNNALLSEAVKLCERRNVGYLQYEKFVYGSKGEDSLTRFKESNGFIRMNLPRYYVPLTVKGFLALHSGLHRSPKDLMPQWMRTRLLTIRDRWHRRAVPHTP